MKIKGHEVFCVYEDARGASDQFLLEKAFNENWILITNDKDFGEKIFRQSYPHHGVILLRLKDERAANKIMVIGEVLENHLSQIPNQFVVVSDTHIRFSNI